MASSHVIPNLISIKKLVWGSRAWDIVNADAPRALPAEARGADRCAGRGDASAVGRTSGRRPAFDSAVCVLQAERQLKDVQHQLQQERARSQLKEESADRDRQL